MQRWQRFLVLAFWLVFFISFWLYVNRSEQSATELLQVWLQGFSSSQFGPLLLLGIFIIRPVFLLPISILNVFAGFAYGPIWGSLYAVIATLISASIPYGMGRFFGTGFKPEQLETKLVRRMRERSFDTILLSRLIFIPGDLVNYAAGFLRISFIAFVLATALGGIPSLLMTTLAGASIEGQFAFTGLRLNIWYLVASGGLLIFSLLSSYVLRKRSDLNEPQPES
ncbi:MAG: TVP38/TMEM64 family protein [Trueperaceae bacterium]|nr:TVP38/TMEM64 family protein [Trueperaceae bacterium]